MTLVWQRRSFPLTFAAAAAYFLYRVQDILLPFVLAAVLAYLFNPLVRFFEVRGLRRRPVVLILYISLMTIITLSSYKLAWVAAFEAEEAAHNMPVYVQKGGEAFSRLRASLKSDPKHDDGRPFQTLAHRAFANTSLLDYVAEHGRTWPEEVLKPHALFCDGHFAGFGDRFSGSFHRFFLNSARPQNARSHSRLGAVALCRDGAGAHGRDR